MRSVTGSTRSRPSSSWSTRRWRSMDQRPQAHATCFIARLYPRLIEFGRRIPQTASLTAADTTAGAMVAYNLVQKLSPENDMQRRLQSQALQLLQELGQTRWLLAAQLESRTVPLPFLVIVVFWLTVLFASFGLFSPLNATAIGVLFVCALSVSAAIFLFLELGRPFEGPLQLSSSPMRHALARIGK